MNTPPFIDVLEQAKKDFQTEKISQEKIITEIEKLIKNSSNILLTAYHRFDGDAVGCEIAMYWALKKINKTALIFNKNMAKEKILFKFLEGFETIETSLENLKGKKLDLIITFDSGEFPDLDEIKSITGNIPVINIDHHKTSSFYGDINWVVPAKAATAELVFELIKKLNIEIDKKIGEALFVSISTDTGRFTFPNTTPQTFEIAAELSKYHIDLGKIYLNLYCNRTINELRLQAECIEKIQLINNGKIALVALDKNIFEKLQFTPVDFQDYIDLIKSINGVEVALLLREENGKIRTSIRTNGRIDAAELAEKFGGGGHSRAAGCTFALPLETAVNKLLEILNTPYYAQKLS